MTKRALILELRRVHGFVISTQYEFLRQAGYEVHIVIMDYLTDRDLIFTFTESVVITVIKRRNPIAGIVKLYFKMLLGRYDFIVLNTIHVESMLLMLAQPHQFRAVVHNVIRDYFAWKGPRFVDNFEHLVRRLFFWRVERLYFLSELTYQWASKDQPPDPRLSTFTPAYFPTLRIKSPPPDGRITFAIPGKVLNTRRNYESLITCFDAIHDSALADQIEFKLLGTADEPDGIRFLEAARNSGILGTVLKPPPTSLMPFLPFAEQFATCHFVLVLIDNTLSKYNRAVAPSSIMLGRGFGVPLVSSSDLPLEPDLLPYTVLYEGQAVLDGIIKAVKIAHSPEYETMRSGFRQHMQDLYPVMERNYLR